MKRYCLALDLKDEEQLIEQYENYHKNVSEKIIQSIREAGVEQLDIYRTGNRLMMIMEVADTFSFEKKTAMDAANKYVQEWETLMWQFQQALPWAKEGEKWILMAPVFKLP